MRRRWGEKMRKKGRLSPPPTQYGAYSNAGTIKGLFQDCRYLAKDFFYESSKLTRSWFILGIPEFTGSIRSSKTQVSTWPTSWSELDLALR